MIAEAEKRHAFIQSKRNRAASQAMNNVPFSSHGGSISAPS
jgi:hypothetical protein